MLHLATDVLNRAAAHTPVRNTPRRKLPKTSRERALGLKAFAVPPPLSALDVHNMTSPLSRQFSVVGAVDQRAGECLWPDFWSCNLAAPAVRAARMRFIIFSRQRSASTTFINALNMYPHVACGYELLNPKDSGDDALARREVGFSSHADAMARLPNFMLSWWSLCLVAWSISAVPRAAELATYG